MSLISVIKFADDVGVIIKSVPYFLRQYEEKPSVIFCWNSLRSNFRHFQYLPVDNMHYDLKTYDIITEIACDELEYAGDIKIGQI